ncbi:gasdermin-B [Tenrec ecaudatus]|uniref:gasdermin-B n=1 Tax=Tenrec ecaudatus TaxID=94439 RepID=UPI003F5A3EF0
MFSLFEDITRLVVGELDSGGDMIAVRSAIDADRFNCFYLVAEKRCLFGTQYYPTSLTLQDIMEPDESEKLTDEVDSKPSGQINEFGIKDSVDSMVELKVKVPKTITIELMVQKSQDQKPQKQEAKVSVHRISQHQLDSLVERQLKKKLPHTFEFIRAKKDNLYVVTETLVNEESLSKERTVSFQFLSNAFQIMLSSKYEFGGIGIISFSDKTNSFPEGKSLSLEESQNIKEKVQDLRSDLQDLTEQERRDAINCFTECLREGHLQDLEERVAELWISGELQLTDGPSDPLLRCLFNDAGMLEDTRVEAFQALLDASLGLPGEYQQLLLVVLKEKELPLLLEEVEHVLEKNSGEQSCTHDGVPGGPKEQTLRAFYVVVSILLQLQE